MALESISSLDLLTPEEIEGTRFPEAPDGYEKAHVDSFLLEMAREVRALRRAAEAAGGDRPFLRAGREIGDLLEHAHKVAARIREEAETQAAVTLAQAAAHLSEATTGSNALVHDARREAEQLLEKAREEARRLTDTAGHTKRLAEVRASLAQDDLRRELRKRKEAAKKQADAFLEEAREQHEALERRIGELKQIEGDFLRRLASLNKEIEQKRTEESPTQPETASPLELDEPGVQSPAG